MKQILSILVLLQFSFGYSQTANFWTKKADFGGLKRERAVAFVIDQTAYVGTGIDTAETALKDFWSYDPINDTWSQIADLPGDGRRNAVAFAIGGFGYVGSGINADSSTEPGAAKLSDFYRYDESNNNWTSIASFPGGGGAGIYFATGFAIDSKGYICGGKYGPNNYTSQLWEYKPSIDQWTQLANFPGGLRYQMSSFTIGLKAYVGLGADQDAYNNDIYCFDAATNQWAQVSDLPASVRASAMSFSIGTRGFICMGTNGGFLDDLWEYNPYSDSWSVRAPYGGSSRKSGVAFTIGGKAYVGTGKGYSGKKASFWEYTPYEILNVEQLSAFTFTVFPNPSSDFITIKSDQKLAYSLCSQNGQTIDTIEENWMDIRHLPTGRYLIVARDEANNVVETTGIIKL